MSEPIITFMDNPCYLEKQKLDNSHKFGECEIDGVEYNGYATKRGDKNYLYVVEKEVNHEN